MNLKDIKEIVTYEIHGWGHMTKAVVVDQIVHRLKDYYETEEEICLWLTLPQEQLGNLTATTLIRFDREDEIYQVLDRLDSAAYI